MDLALAKLLLIIVLCTLIVFSGMIVSPAYRHLLDTWYGRLIGLIGVLTINAWMGWPVGMLAAMTLLILMPLTTEEGFVSSSKTDYQENYSSEVTASKDEEKEEETFESRVVPATRSRWFIENVMDESPIEIDTANVETLPTQ